ncbi:GTPase required for pre-60S ribosomal subunit nuclear export and maturation [Diaporthe australafricana]|uniref:Nucleolar GTP-binding protein 2 n=1 Tax=Diaporthe australafricana TaxID=127596 RepID=A0ABR3XBK1_9PEZI
MGNFKKEKSRRDRDGKSTGGATFKIKGENFYRDAKKVKQLNIFKEGKAQRNAEGEITKAASYQSRDVPNARVEPNRKWFSNSRVISQESLSAFRDAIAQKEKDPYTVLLKSNKLPLSLIRDGQDNRVNGLKEHQAKMTVETSPFAEVFGPKSSRKRVKLSVSNIDELAGDSVKSLETYNEKLEEARLLSGELGAEQAEAGDLRRDQEAAAVLTTANEPIFDKGQSKRIWNELYKVIDSSDIILHILDARDPLGTRCRSVEKYLKEEAPHKHLVFILNKCDLVPTKVAAQWVKHLQKDYPTAAFRASINNPFGKGSLINLLRQFSKLHSDRKQVSVGLIGYPNTGKSSIINTLRGKKVATVAPIPGETKVWQYVTLMKRIYLIDCPGIVPQNHHDAPTELLLRGVVRVEKVEHPEQYIPAVLKRVKKHHMAKTYDLSDWNDDHILFLELLARKGGRLLKGGEPDVDGVAKMVLNDFMRGRIPWFVPPPVAGDDKEGDSTEVEQKAPEKVLKKRKRDTVEAEEKAVEEDSSPEDNGEEEFDGFSNASEPEISDDSDSEGPAEDDDDDDDENEADENDAVPEVEDAEEGGAAVTEEKEEEPEPAPEPPTPVRRSSRRTKKPVTFK